MNIVDSTANIFKNIFKSDESKFRLVTSLKITSLPIITSFFMGFTIWLFANMDLIFFQANGYLQVKELREAYFDFLFGELSIVLLYFGIFSIILFFVGNYIAGLLIRPFKILGEYCEKCTNGEVASYNPDLFSDLKLLTRFSEFFFQRIDISISENRWISCEIPETFTKIHKPIFEKVFFFHFCLFLSILCLISSLCIYILTVEIHSSIIELAINTLEQNSSINYFLQQQTELFNAVFTISVGILIFLYVVLVFNLYNKVSGAAFGVFSTMRAFIKGNKSARVHLIGYSYVRPFCRALNKYLDQIERKFDKSA